MRSGHDEPKYVSGAGRALEYDLIVALIVVVILGAVASVIDAPSSLITFSDVAAQG